MMTQTMAMTMQIESPCWDGKLLDSFYKLLFLLLDTVIFIISPNYGSPETFDFVLCFFITFDSLNTELFGRIGGPAMKPNQNPKIKHYLMLHAYGETKRAGDYGFLYCF